METWSEILRSRKFWAAIIASLILKEVITRLSVLTTTGVLKLWSKALYIITLDSASVRDAPYASAGMNSYPLPSLMLVTGILLLVIAITWIILAKSYWRLISGYFKTRHRTFPLAGNWPKGFFQDGKIIKKNVVLLALSSVYLIGFGITLAIPVGIANEAILSRRYYEADRDIVAPYLTSSQLVQFQADFAQVETKAEYKAIMNRLLVIAEQHHVKIHKVDW